MTVNKINLYLFSQITKNFLLILFIFLSIAWLLQITRLFTVTNFFNINVLDIFLLSLYLIPNIITIILPFILIFGLLLCFLKLNRDNELISILSLGLGLKPFRISLLYFSLIIIIIFTILNFYIAPIVYEKYKIKEHELRNTIDFDSMTFSNFLNLNNTTILDFKKNNNEYEDIFITYQDDKDNIVYAQKGNIYIENNQYKFQLDNGFKISINKNEQIEKLEFLNYVLKIQNNNQEDDKITDKNTFTIFDDLDSKNYLNISFKIIDMILILFVIFFFFRNNLKNIKFDSKSNIFFCILCISILIVNQILKNSEINIFNYNAIIIALLIISLLLSYIKKKYE